MPLLIALLPRYQLVTCYETPEQPACQINRIA
jgi:hypothetical protein